MKKTKEEQIKPKEIFQIILFFVLVFFILLSALYVIPLIFIEEDEFTSACERIGAELWSHDNQELKCLTGNTIRTFAYKCDWGFYDVDCDYIELNSNGGKTK